MTRLFSYRKAAKIYGIPEKTLREDTRLKRVQKGSNWVRLREQDIDSWLAKLAEHS